MDDVQGLVNRSGVHAIYFHHRVKQGTRFSRLPVQFWDSFSNFLCFSKENITFSLNWKTRIFTCRLMTATMSALCLRLAPTPSCGPFACDVSK